MTRFRPTLLAVALLATSTLAYERLQGPTELLFYDQAKAFNGYTLFGVGGRKPHLLWALRVQGDSMIGAHIVDGDIVVLERREPRVGEIIAALVDGTSSTLKRLVREGGRSVLRAENERYADIVPEQGLESQGVVVGVIRRNVE